MRMHMRGVVPTGQRNCKLPSGQAQGIEGRAQVQERQQTWATMKGRSEKPESPPRREAPSHSPTRGTRLAAVSARAYAASAPAHAWSAMQSQCGSDFSGDPHALE